MKNKWEILNEYYISKGLKIFPVVENGKTPMLKAWNTECSSNYLQVLYWVENARNCNWGLPCKENNLFVLDLDVHNPEANGVENFDKIIDKLFLDKNGFAGDLYDEFMEMAPLEQVTPSGGRHLIFQSDDELRQVPSAPNAFKDYPGIDIRNSSYIIVEPSEINGNKYIFDTIPSSPPKMHPKLKKFILENVGTKQDNKKTPYEKPKEVSVGDRDNQLFQYINQLYYKTRLDYDEILVLAKYFNMEILEEPFDERDVKYKVKKAFEKKRSKCIFVIINDDEE